MISGDAERNIECIGLTLSTSPCGTAGLHVALVNFSCDGPAFMASASARDWLSGC